MRAYWRYLKYVLIHKWHVLQAGIPLGVPLWMLILHDWDKLLPSMFIPYARTFYGRFPTREMVARAEYIPGVVVEYPYCQEDLAVDFDLAWLGHQGCNKHHWQWWVLLNDDGSIRALEMPDVHRREMLADWIGAGRASGKTDTVGWYLSTCEGRRLHPRTQFWIEVQLGIVPEKPKGKPKNDDLYEGDEL